MMMMHNNTKSGYKRLSGPEYIVWTTIHCNFEPYWDLDLEHFDSQDTLAYDDAKFVCTKLSMIIWVLSVTVALSKPSFCMTLHLMHDHTKAGYNRLSIEDLIWTKSRHKDKQEECDRHSQSNITPLTFLWGV